jgi:uncharacterized protein (DUF2141 family)
MTQQETNTGLLVEFDSVRMRSNLVLVAIYKKFQNFKKKFQKFQNYKKNNSKFKVQNFPKISKLKTNSK